MRLRAVLFFYFLVMRWCINESTSEIRQYERKHVSQWWSWLYDSIILINGDWLDEEAQERNREIIRGYSLLIEESKRKALFGFLSQRGRDRENEEFFIYVIFDNTKVTTFQFTQFLIICIFRYVSSTSVTIFVHMRSTKTCLNFPYATF